jgi:DNA modification methylase
MSMGMIINGDSLNELKKLPEKSYQSCITSPPYFHLRDYGIEGQIGMENTLSDYINNLVCIFSEIRRVLKDDGTLWLNIGDTYSGNNSLRKGRAEFEDDRIGFSNNTFLDNQNRIPPKNLMGVPWRLALALQSDGWILRQDIIWRKPNPMPSPVTDRCTNSHEYLFLLAKNPKYYFNSDAIKEPVSESYAKDKRPKGVLRQRLYRNSKYAINGMYNIDKDTIGDKVPTKEEAESEVGMRNKHSVWDITVKPFREAHFAVMPIELVNNCILAGTKEGDTVIDPFFGAGTVGKSAIENNRDFVGIELNPDYIKIAEKRLNNTQPCLL